MCEWQPIDVILALVMFGLPALFLLLIAVPVISDVIKEGRKDE